MLKVRVKKPFLHPQRTLQLPSILEAVLPSATWRRAMQWWQGATDHGVLHTPLSEMSELLAKSASKHVSPDQRVSAQQMIWAMLADRFAVRRQSLSFPYQKALPYTHIYFRDLPRTTNAFPNFRQCHTIVNICSSFFCRSQIFFLRILLNYL